MRVGQDFFVFVLIMSITLKVRRLEGIRKD